MSFVHLRCHSCFSLLEGAAAPQQLLDAARAGGFKALALTDTNGLYAAPAFWKKAVELGIKPILGAELTTSLDRRDRGERVVVLAGDRQGFASVCRLVTARQLESSFDLAERITDEAARGRLFVLTESEELLRRLAGKLPPETLHAELCPRGNKGDSSRLAKLAVLAGELGLPLAGTANVHFVEPEDIRAHKLLRSIDLGGTLHSLRETEHLPESCHLVPAREMAERLAAWPEAIANTARIAELCNCALPAGERTIFPSVELPRGESAYSALLKAAFRGACRRYRPMNVRVLERLRKELDVIDRQGFAEYFLVVSDIARFARRRRIPMVGRGSAANSIVSYCLGITDVDPLRYNLFFERFMNPERSNPPDVDLDFSWRRRDEVLEYVYRRHGVDRVAMICSYVTFSARLAVREIARVMGLSPEEITRFTRLLPYNALKYVDSLEEKWPECRSLPLREEPYASILQLARRISGFPRHLSIHSGGIVVAPHPLTDLVPLERAAKGLVVTQYDMHGIEDLGLVKIDLLGNRSLAVIEKAARRVEAREGVKLDILEDIDRLEKDPGTARLVEEGRTMGCFYIESPAMRQLLVKLRVRSYEELTAASSVIRPGVAESGMMQQYIERHRGLQPVEYLDPRMEAILGETHGVMVYQEDVIRVAHEIAGMSLGEADLLRRAMSGKMRSREAMRPLERRFVEMAVRRGVKPAAAAEIWRQIASFAGYSFCKAHSAAYARVSYQAAYLKAHHPAEFMAAVLANEGGFYGPSAYIEEARRMGIEIRPPDVNRSGMEYSGEGRVIQAGFDIIGSVTHRTLEAIVEARDRGGLFTSLSDFRARVDVSRLETQTLVRCGVFDSFELTRPELLFRLEFLFGKGSGKNGNGDRSQAALLFAGTETDIARSVVPRLTEYPRSERLRIEREVFGFTVTEHPLALLDRRNTLTGLVAAVRIPEYEGRRIRIVGRPISRKRIMTGKGAMMFLSLDDTSAPFEVAIFADCYRHCAGVAMGPGPFLVTAKVKKEHGVHTLVCERLQRLETPAESVGAVASWPGKELPPWLSGHSGTRQEIAARREEDRNRSRCLSGDNTHFWTSEFIRPD